MTDKPITEPLPVSPAVPAPLDAEVAKLPEHDPAADRLYHSPMPIGEGVPFDPELYQPLLTPEELEALDEEEDDDD